MDRIDRRLLMNVMFALLLIPGSVALGSASSRMARDVGSVSLQAETGVWIRLSVPESLRNDQCERRLYGTQTGIGGMFHTLYFERRRTESYEAAIRELALQPELSSGSYDRLSAELKRVGVSAEDAQQVLNLVKHGSSSIKKNYVKGGTLTASARNRLARVGRKLNSTSKSPTFSQVCLLLENVKATAQITETVAGAFLLNALATDAAEQRLRVIRTAVRAAERNGARIDPALQKGLATAETNIAAARQAVGAFVVSVNDRMDRIADSALNLGGTLAEMSAKFSPAVAMWVGAPLMTYNTLRSVSDQWEMAQDAVTVASLTQLIQTQRMGGSDGDTLASMSRYGEYVFYSLMERTFSVGGAKFKDLLSPGHANKDWATYYGSQRRSVLLQ